MKHGDEGRVSWPTCMDCLCGASAPDSREGRPTPWMANSADFFQQLTSRIERQFPTYDINRIFTNTNPTMKQRLHLLQELHGQGQGQGQGLQVMFHTNDVLMEDGGEELTQKGFSPTFPGTGLKDKCYGSGIYMAVNPLYCISFYELRSKRITPPKNPSDFLRYRQYLRNEKGSLPGDQGISPELLSRGGDLELNDHERLYGSPDGPLIVNTRNPAILKEGTMVEDTGVPWLPKSRVLASVVFPGNAKDFGGSVLGEAGEAQEVLATALEGGKQYTISDTGNTTFTEIGAPDNHVGTTFVAKGVGQGNGKVISIDRAIKPLEERWMPTLPFVPDDGLKRGLEVAGRQHFTVAATSSLHGAAAPAATIYPDVGISDLEERINIQGRLEGKLTEEIDIIKRLSTGTEKTYFPKDNVNIRTIHTKKCGRKGLTLYGDLKIYKISEAFPFSFSDYMEEKHTLTESTIRTCKYFCMCSISDEKLEGNPFYKQFGNRLSAPHGYDTVCGNEKSFMDFDDQDYNMRGNEAMGRQYVFFDWWRVVPLCTFEFTCVHKEDIGACTDGERTLPPIPDIFDGHIDVNVVGDQVNLTMSA